MEIRRAYRASPGLLPKLGHEMLGLCYNAYSANSKYLQGFLNFEIPPSQLPKDVNYTPQVSRWKSRTVQARHAGRVVATCQLRDDSEPLGEVPVTGQGWLLKAHEISNQIWELPTQGAPKMVERNLPTPILDVVRFQAIMAHLSGPSLGRIEFRAQFPRDLGEGVMLYMEDITDEEAMLFGFVEGHLAMTVQLCKQVREE